MYEVRDRQVEIGVEGEYTSVSWVQEWFVVYYTRNYGPATPEGYVEVFKCFDPDVAADFMFAMMEGALRRTMAEGR